MNERPTNQSGPDDAHGAETGHEQAHSDEVDVEPGPQGPGSRAGTRAGKTGGLPGREYSSELPMDEADDTVLGSEPYEESERRTEP
ncbi:hypothetical protein [Phytoactinopolyspora halotolerans]|uniref:Uncharacterized protein n=1 Tax=Phytoactinopolyspora halotolerans TaxID=1981512 RepID=A0A6L9SJ96_9ACTN|nr:hypothetical protein [Phytoactinopolyspora halotolerans]NEE04361.1 hypothetical protein [Phytoactinopolyspora halotolerans]